MRAGGAVPDLLTDLRWYYDLDEASGNAIANYGSGGNLTANGAPGQSDGPIGNARSLNGTSQYFSSGAGIISHFELPTESAFTLSFWFYPTSATGNRDIIGIGNGADWNFSANLSWGVRLLNSSGLVRFAFDDEGLISNLDSDTGVSLNNWHHLLLSDTGTIAYLSIDGAAPSTKLHGAIIRNSLLTTLYIGAIETYFAGRLTRFGFWDRYIEPGSAEAIALATYPYTYAELT